MQLNTLEQKLIYIRFAASWLQTLCKLNISLPWRGREMFNYLCYTLFNISLLFIVGNSFGQKGIITDSIRLVGISKPEAIKAAAKYYQTPILFSDNFFSHSSSISITLGVRPLEKILSQIVEGESLSIINRNRSFLIKKLSESIILSGYIKERLSNESLPFATLLIDGSIPVVANEDGYFNLKIKKGYHQLKVNYLAHKDTVMLREFQKNERLTLYLTAENTLEEVIVEEGKPSYEKHVVNRYSHNDLLLLSKKTPDMGGTSDLLQSARLLPGVQSGAGGIGGHFVRGGDNGSNLYLLDGAPIYNPYHIFGLTSIFNPIVTKSFQVMKSGFPATFGDVTSAIFDVKIKDGSSQQLRYDFVANTNDVSANLEIPIIKNKSALLLYGRKDFTDFYYDEIIADALNQNSSDFLRKNYDDLIAKFHTHLGKNHLLRLGFYHSSDQIRVNTDDHDFFQDSQLNWKSDILSFKWNYIINPKTFLKTSIHFNSYNTWFAALESYNFEEEEAFGYFESGSANYAISVTSELDMLLQKNNRLRVSMGLQLNEYMPSSVFYDDFSIFEAIPDTLSIELFNDFTTEQGFRTTKFSLAFDHIFTLDQLVIRTGLRNVFYKIGSFDQFSIQPRLSIDYQFIPNHYFHFNYTNTRQFDHLIGNSALLLPPDYWLPSSKELPPQVGHILDFAYSFYAVRSKYFEISAYWKKVNNNVVQDYNLEAFAEPNLYIGQSQGYGLELSYNKTEGRTTYRIAYALAKADRKFWGLNLNKKFAFQFDRRHELKALLAHNLHSNLIIGANLYLGSGHPRLNALTGNLESGVVAFNISGAGLRNLQREDTHFRADLSITYQRQLKKLHHYLKASFFNVFNIEKPLYYIYDGQLSQPKLSLPFLPSLSYRVSFSY